MSTPKHTPGPWVVNDNDTGMTDDGTIINLHGTVIVSSVYGQTTEIAAANAALIAAAPAMYEALQQLVHVEQLRKQAVTENDYVDLVLADSKLQQLVQAVLAQAEGRQG